MFIEMGATMMPRFDENCDSDAYWWLIKCMIILKLERLIYNE